MAIQAAGARVLTAVEPAPLLGRLMPTKQLRERVEVGVEYMKKAKTLRITSKAGTDVLYKMGVYPTVGEYGCTDEAGRWDHWPAAFVFSGAADDGVDGQIVLAPGDVLLPLNIYVREPVIYTIEKGFIQDIRGGLEADLIKSYMKTFNDPRGMGMSHVGWGLDHRANWHGLCDFGGGMAWNCAPSTETSCSPPARTTSWAARTTPHAIWTFRCAVAASSSMTSRWCSTATSP